MADGYGIKLGTYWLQGAAGWGPKSRANSYASEQAAREAAQRLRVDQCARVLPLSGDSAPPPPPGARRE